MADIPKEVRQEIERLEQMFTVPKEKLKLITDHFVDELAKGTVNSFHNEIALTFSRPYC